VAQRTVVTTTDDVDGSPASETVAFAVDGQAFEIDLSAEHAAELRATFEPYISAGRRVGGVGRRASVRAVKVATGYSAPAVRAWAASNRVEIPNKRGRIPAAVVAQYHAAGN
jgi:hypothetical protein